MEMYQHISNKRNLKSSFFFLFFFWSMLKYGWKSHRFGFFRKKKKMLGITTLHNGRILSILSTSSRGFAFGFPKGLIPKYTLEQPPLNRDSTSFSRALEQSTPFVRKDYIDMAKLREWLWCHVRNHDSPQWYDIVHFEHKLSWLYFWFPKRPHINGDVFLTYKPIIIL